MSGPIATTARAYRVFPATIGVLACFLLAIFFKNTSIGLGGLPVRSLWFLALGVLVFGSLPLPGVFGILERTFVKWRSSRAMRASWHLGVTTSVAAGLTSFWAESGLSVWFVCLAALAVMWSIVQPETTMLVVLAVGSGTIFLDHSVGNYPISQMMERLGVGPAAGLYAVGLGAYVVLADGLAVRRRL